MDAQAARDGEVRRLLEAALRALDGGGAALRVHWALRQVSVFVAVVAVLAGRPVLARGVSSAGPPAVAARELAGLVPALDSRRHDLKSFEVKGFVSFNETHHMAFHCVSTVPQEAWVVLIDEVPFFVAAEDHILLYDALSGPRPFGIRTGRLPRHRGWRIEVQR